MKRLPIHVAFTSHHRPISDSTIDLSLGDVDVGGPASKDRQAALQNEHLEVVFCKGEAADRSANVFAMPSPSSKSFDGPSPRKFIVFKIVSLHPDRRSYLQRAYSLSSDDAGLS